MPTRDELEPLYRQTSYVARIGGTSWELRVGAFHAEFDQWLLRQGFQTWAFLTAWNPGSRPLPMAENQRRLAELEALVRAAGLVAYPGVGELNAWREESLLILGPSLQQALDWARTFGQLALVWGQSGGAAELLWTCGPSAEETEGRCTRHSDGI